VRIAKFVSESAVPDEFENLVGAYLTDHASIRCRNMASGEIRNYDPEHPVVIKRLRSGELVRVQ
jgi:hypothetical protein